MINLGMDFTEYRNAEGINASAIKKGRELI